MFLPGDWHTGINMLQSVFNLFWSDLLKPLHDLLGWKRISQDVRGCYFQASCQVKYANKVLLSYLMRLYIFRYYEFYADYMMDSVPPNVLCHIALDYQLFLEWLGRSTDEHLRLIVNFILVSSDFLEFLLAYRSQDSVTVEHGYKWFAPIWKILGQVKYLEATWE
jgi:hypothetical protein